MAGSGPRNSRWNGGLIVDTEGYPKAKVGRSHPLADARGYAHLHALVWASARRAPPRPDEILHHRDEDKTHFALGNLRKKPRAVHSAEHAAKQRRDRRGRFS